MIRANLRRPARLAAQALPSATTAACYRR